MLHTEELLVHTWKSHQGGRNGQDLWKNWKRGETQFLWSTVYKVAFSSDRYEAITLKRIWALRMELVTFVQSFLVTTLEAYLQVTTAVQQ
jgi:hypothetical protein